MFKIGIPMFSNNTILYCVIYKLGKIAYNKIS